jgi:hypothetical protein
MPCRMEHFILTDEFQEITKKCNKYDNLSRTLSQVFLYVVFVISLLILPTTGSTLALAATALVGFVASTLLQRKSTDFKRQLAHKMVIEHSRIELEKMV